MSLRQNIECSNRFINKEKARDGRNVFFKNADCTEVCIVCMYAAVYLSVIVFPQPAHSCCVEPFLFVSDLLTSIVIVISATAPSKTLKANHIVTIISSCIVAKKEKNYPK